MREHRREALRRKGIFGTAFWDGLLGDTEYPSIGDVTGVWWLQVTFGDGLAYWSCKRCRAGDDSYSMLWARARLFFHRCRPITPEAKMLAKDPPAGPNPSSI